MLVKLTKEQQLTVKRLFDRFKNNLSDKSYLKFRKRVHKAIGFNGEYDMRVLTIDEVNLTFGIETDGYGHTWSNYLLQEMPPSGGIFFVRDSGFGVLYNKETYNIIHCLLANKTLLNCNSSNNS